MSEFRDAVLRVVAELQEGEVVSYSEVARRAGRPRAARAVGTFLADSDGDVPWWRVVARDGSLVSPSAREQRRRLLAEGVDVLRGKVVGGVP